MAPQDASSLFLQHLDTALLNDTLQRLILGKYRGDEVDLQKVRVAKVMIKRAPHLSFTYRYKTRDIVKNLSISEGRGRIVSLLGSEFLTAHLFSDDKEYALEYSKKRIPHLRVHEGVSTPQSKGHNREKNYLIPLSAPFLQPLAIANSHGEVRGERYDKYRQINKFIEIIDSLLTAGKAYEKGKIKVVDFGSGKNYLTFALYYFLTEIRGKKAEVVGVELRKELVEHGSSLAASLKFDGLKFFEGHIGQYPLEGVDLVVALHACDTATDDALAQAITAQATVIAVAPCCQRYLRSRMKTPEALRPILKHGILEERHAESLTDGLRALALEGKGYNAKVFEFISAGHTPKNVMITGVLGTRESVAQKRREEILVLKREYQLEDFYLDTLIDITP